MTHKGSKIRNILTEEHAGFSGVTHWLIAISLFFLMWLAPIAFAQGYIAAITKSWIFAFIIFMVIGGASLLPDLDSSPLQEGGSTAVYQLGILGQALSLVAITISSVIWNVVHTRYDEKPPSQHRMFFHAPFVALIIFVFNWWSYPSSSATAASLGFKGVPASVYTIILMAAISVYLGASMFFYKVLSLLRRQKHTQFFCLAFMAFSCWSMWNMPFHELKLIGTAIALGYLFHIIGDVITKGSAPLFFPIPTPVKTSKGIKLRFWWKPYIFGGKFNITTGGAVNIILNFALMGVNLFLAWYLFIRR
jgi:membrane-bound metal-dependent hydrolase YbcI (DUF457 family)